LPEEVTEMEKRLSSRDAIFDPAPDADDDHIFTPAAYLPAANADPAVLLEDEDWHDDATARMTDAIGTLDDRSRAIVESRWLSDDKKTLHISRTFQAAKSRVWEAYTNPELLAQWWGPVGWETEIKHMDFSVGGYWHYCMRCVDKAQGDYYGMESWGKGTFTAIAPKDRFSYDDEFCTATAEPVPGMPVSHSTVLLKENAGSTLMSCTTTYDTPEALQQVLEMGMEEGFNQTLDNLEKLLARQAA